MSTVPASVLFACSHNAIRSPMAEALAKRLYGHTAFVDSVGVHAGERDSFAAAALDELGIAHDPLIVSAHRTPDRLYKFAKSAKKQGYKVVIAGAGGAAHLPGMTASLTTLPVLGVPMKTSALEGKDSLLSILQMPAGIPVGTLAIGKPGAINAALLAASILALSDAKIAKRLEDFRQRQTASIGKRPQDTKPKKRNKR